MLVERSACNTVSAAVFPAIGDQSYLRPASLAELESSGVLAGTRNASKEKGREPELSPLEEPIYIGDQLAVVAFRRQL